MMVFFSKVTCLQFTDCKSSIKRLLHRSFSEYVSKASFLKKNILTKRSMADQCFNKVEPAKPITLSKNGAHLRPFCRSAVNSNIFTRKPPWWRFLFSKSRVAALEFIPAIWFKKSSTTNIFARYLCQTFFNKVPGLQSIGCYFIKNSGFLKNM